MLRTPRKSVPPLGRRFQPGQSGNPGGRPKTIIAVAELARQHTTEAIETLVEIMRDGKATASARVSAATELLDRGHGRAPAEVTVKTDPRDMTNLELAQVLCEGLDTPEKIHALLAILDGGENLAAITVMLDGMSQEPADALAEIPAPRGPLATAPAPTRRAGA